VIDVDPDYQREVVWTGESTQFGCSRRMLIAIAERMTGLVDSSMGMIYPTPTQQARDHRSLTFA
jgi:hypothetical protein